MTISVRKTGADSFAVTVGHATATVDGNGLKSLLLQITQILMPGANLGASPRQNATDVAARLKRANDVGVQALIRAVEHDDILVLLKVGENDRDLTRKLYDNMSERMRKMCVEDMLFKFKEGIADETVGAAMGRVGRKAADLEVAGTLTYE